MTARSLLEVGKRIRAARKAGGLTQQELSVLAGITVSQISRWENDHQSPHPSSIANLAAALGVPPYALIDTEDAIRDDSLGQRLRRLRALRGLSVRQLGKVLGVSYVTVSQWENGTTEPRAGSIRRLAITFGISADYLIFGHR